MFLPVLELTLMFFLNLHNYFVLEVDSAKVSTHHCIAACVSFLALDFGETEIHRVTQNSLTEYLAPATILFL